MSLNIKILMMYIIVLKNKIKIIDFKSRIIILMKYLDYIDVFMLKFVIKY